MNDEIIIKLKLIIVIIISIFKAFIYVASMVIIYALSVVFSLLFEIPLVGLDRLLFKR